MSDRNMTTEQKVDRIYDFIFGAEGQPGFADRADGYFKKVRDNCDDIQALKGVAGLVKWFIGGVSILVIGIVAFVLHHIGMS